MVRQENCVSVPFYTCIWAILTIQATPSTLSNNASEMKDMDFSCGVEDEALYRSNLFSRELWPNGRVPYLFDSTFTETFQKTFLDAVDMLKKETCVRFEPKTEQDVGYVRTSVIHDDVSYCGIATICNTKQEQKLRIRWNCNTKSLMVHEMLHSLCIIHEQNRVDRDQFLIFRNCDKPPLIAESQIHVGNLYDYNSVTHYFCGDGCHGLPIMDGVNHCGNEGGLSVLDADKINTYYECGGCHTHRWYNHDNMTPTLWTHVVNFAEQNIDTEPLYICRGYGLYGEILPGRYLTAQKFCQVNTGGIPYTIKKHIELFALPPNGKISTAATSSPYYRLVKYDQQNDESKYVAVGQRHRTFTTKLYLVITNDHPGGNTIVGSLKERDSKPMYVEAATTSITPTTFNVLECQ